MPKLRVTVESDIDPRRPDVTFIELDGSETKEQLEQMAEDIFAQCCSYGWDVVETAETEEGEA